MSNVSVTLVERNQILEKHKSEEKMCANMAGDINRYDNTKGEEQKKKEKRLE